MSATPGKAARLSGAGGPGFSFKLVARSGAARSGEIHTPRGVIETPAFMPVGTQATIKAMYPEQIRATGAQIVLANTYHLMLRPGAARVAMLGGLHRFMNWPHPVLTDSGGFQVMSLGGLARINDEGVQFQSHIDGSRHTLTPRSCMEVQHLLGSDICMQLDQCVRLPASPDILERAMQRSLAWAGECREQFMALGCAQKGQALYGIVQGGDNEALRLRSADRLQDIGFDGYAIGGLAVGESADDMYRVLDVSVPALPEEKPRYLMGVGTPENIVEAVCRGIDQFDCVMPTRAGRHGLAFTRQGKLNMRNARHRDDPAPLDGEAACPASSNYSRAYLHHLVACGEPLGGMLLTWNNIACYQALMRDLRAAIRGGYLERFRREFYAARNPRPDGAKP